MKQICKKAGIYARNQRINAYFWSRRKEQGDGIAKNERPGFEPCHRSFAYHLCIK